MFYKIFSILIIFFFNTSYASSNYRLLELYVSSSGSDNAIGSINKPIASLMEAQKRADKYLSLLKPNGIHKNDYIKIRINISGVFNCQTFTWKHSHQSVHLHIRNQEGSTAELNGHRSGCYDSNEDGLSFFVAWGLSYALAPSVGFTGYGTIAIEGLTIKHYGSGINLSAYPEIKPGLVSIKRNIFYRIGQIVNPDVWKPLYSVIQIRNIDNAEITDNTFIQIANVVDTSLMHGVYLINSDKTLIHGNYFDNISGPPIKLRNSSDQNTMTSNVFLKGSYSTHNFPVQNWYDNWWLTDLEAGPDRELPSFNNKMYTNDFLGGYLDYPISEDYEEKKSICVNRIVATPDVLPQSYLNAATIQKTSSRFDMDGKKVYGEHWSQLNCQQFNNYGPDDL